MISLFDEVIENRIGCSCDGCKEWTGEVVCVVEPFVVVKWSCARPFKIGKKTIKYRECYIWYWPQHLHWIKQKVKI